MRFRPTFWPTVFTIFSVLVLIGLGTWQLDRLGWKTALIDSFESLLKQTLETDFATARRLYTLICVRHIRG